MKKLSILCLLGVLLILNSCSKEFTQKEIEVPNTETKTDISTLKVSSEFKWATVKDVQLTLSANYSSIIKVVSPSGKVYQKAYLWKGQEFKMDLDVPSYETNVRLLFMNKDVTINISSGNSSYVFE